MSLFLPPEAVGAVFSARAEKLPVTETLTIPAHIENGSVRLDAPLPSGIISVELRVRRADRDTPRRSLAEYVRSLPPGSRTAEEIDEQFRESRADRL